ncbi:iron-sulfur cluster assembly scaffold protein [Thiotrichales bacterium 19S9-12]|nr:iron-sulfur cluster assembly scaffold protein [Thiotrichales bacterium 19S9-11]MCF6811266.1 iron-sulfur cluster assembly scaffold protein [Thiotrichales bacterium 19S9-12]
MYTKKVLEYYQKIPVNMRLFSDADETVKTYTVGGYTLGEKVIFQIKESNTKFICRYQVYGCGYMIALVVWLAEELQAGKIDDLLKVNISDLVTLFDLPSVKRHSALSLLKLIEVICNDRK